jgi:tRNA(Ile)-lysidine synthase
MDITKTIRLVPGHYVIAVSGGVDSMVLLDILRQKDGVTLTVAHFDHGIRDVSHFDRLLVQEVAQGHGLPFVYAEGKLGSDSSEDQARQARYRFLHKVQRQTNASGIITAHHMDDVMETAVHNILRGTGRKGMTSLKSVDGIIRPLLHLPKQHLHTYAQKNQLQWAEDDSNQNLKYRRNYIRHVLLPKLKAASPTQYERLKMLIRRQHEINNAIDMRLTTILHTQPSPTKLRRHDVVMLPHKVAGELIMEWLRHRDIRSVTRKQVERLLIAIKTAQPNTDFEIDKDIKIHFTKQYASLIKK